MKSEVQKVKVSHVFVFDASLPEEERVYKSSLGTFRKDQIEKLKPSFSIFLPDNDRDDE